MRELDHKECWVLKNWCFWTVVLEKTLESSLDCKEIKPVNPKRKSVLNIHWKDWCWSWSSNTLATWCKEPTHWKRLWCWERLKVGGEGGIRGQDGWMASLTQRTQVWSNSRKQWRTGKPGVLQSLGSQIVKYDWVTKQLLLKAIYSFSATSIKISMIFFLCRNRKRHPKVHWESQRVLNRQNHLQKDEKSHRTHTFESQHTLQSFSNQNYVIIIQK